MHACHSTVQVHTRNKKGGRGGGVWGGGGCRSWLVGSGRVTIGPHAYGTQGLPAQLHDVAHVRRVPQKAPLECILHKHRAA